MPEATLSSAAAKPSTSAPDLLSLASNSSLDHGDLPNDTSPQPAPARHSSQLPSSSTSHAFASLDPRSANGSAHARSIEAAAKGQPPADDEWDNWNVEDEPRSSLDSMPSDLRSDHAGGKSHSRLGLLSNHIKDDSHSNGFASSPGHRTARLHARDPDMAAKDATRQRYTIAGAFLLISLASFTIQTETAVYIQHNLDWEKPYCMLWLTHGSWSLLWPTQLAILRLQKLNVPWHTFWRRHASSLTMTAHMVRLQKLRPSMHEMRESPWPYIVRTTAFVTSALTVAGGSWYVAVNMTTASDLTAIYNCSAFFAYAFSIPLLNEKLRWSKVVAVAIAILGVLVVAYGDTSVGKHGSKSGSGTGGPQAPPDEEANNRPLGNIIIGVGSILYGFYEVLYKKVACPPDGCSPNRGMLFANTFGSCIGLFTLCVLWIPLPILHITGIETFEFPWGKVGGMLAISVLANATFSGSFLVLISLTSPVLSSVAALMTIFIVAITDQLLPPPLYSPLTKAAGFGGLLIIVAFGMLAWATYREMSEEAMHTKVIHDVAESDFSDEDDDDVY